VAPGKGGEDAACSSQHGLKSLLREIRAALGTASGYNGNAIKYGHPSGVSGEIKVTCCQDQKDGLVIRVIDDGVGRSP